MFNFLLEIACSFLMAMSVIFIVIELRARFDKSFLIFGITNLLLASFCAIDIWIQPGVQTLAWTRIQHVIATFFPAFILWYLMILLRKEHDVFIRFLFFIGFCFSILFFTNIMLKPSEKEIGSTMVYNVTFAPYILGAIIYIVLFLFLNFRISQQKEKKVLLFHVLGISALALGGILDMITIFIGHRVTPGIATYTMPGVLLFGLIVTYVFIDRLTAIIRTREITFGKLQEAYKELEMTRPLAILGRSITMVNHEIKHKTFNLSLILRSMRQITLPAPVIEKLDECDSVVNTIAQFTKDILAQSGIFQFHKQHIDLCSCIKESIRSSLAICNADIVFKGPDAGLHVLGDRIKLQSVFENLIINGIQAGATTIEIRLNVKDGNMTVDIEDNGAGCDAETVKCLFTPFFTTKSGSDSSGLGLCIAQTIIENLGGRISVHSKNLSADGHTGMIFSIILPVTGVQAVSKHEAVTCA
jgi:signal transduction histidine kinase